MTETSTPSGATSVPAQGLLSRFIGIITSPKATFQAVVAHPKWLGMFLLTTLIVACCTSFPMFTEWGRQAALDQQVHQMESFGMKVDEAQYAPHGARDVVRGIHDVLRRHDCLADLRPDH